MPVLMSDGERRILVEENTKKYITPINFKHFCKTPQNSKTPTTSHYSAFKILLRLDLQNYPSWDISHASGEKHCLDLDVMNDIYKVVITGLQLMG